MCESENRVSGSCCAEFHSLGHKFPLVSGSEARSVLLSLFVNDVKS